MTKRGSAALAVVTAMNLMALGCSSGEGGGGGGGGVSGGGNAIDLSGGGSAGTAVGGDAGYMYVESYAPGGVKLKRSGTADTSFTVRPYVGPVNLGPSGVDLAASATAVRLAAGAADPGPGALYVVAGNAVLYAGDGAGTVPDGAEEVSGVRLAAGVALDVDPNLDSNGDGHPDVAWLTFSGDVEIGGTLTTGALDANERGGVLATDRAALRVDARQVLVRSTGRVALRGGDAAAGGGERGGHGGYAFFQAGSFLNDGVIDASGGAGDGAGNGGDAGISSAWGSYVAVEVGGGSTWMGRTGGLVNRGRILCVGGDGASGGAGAEINLFADAFVVNSGELVEKGGAGLDGQGGSGDWEVELRSYSAGVVNAGAIVAEGGSGTAGAGQGGYVYLSAGDAGSLAGDVVSSGSISAGGGDATAAGDGGSAGGVYLYAHGAIRTGGSLSVDGGDGNGAGAYGGEGGEVYLENYPGYDAWSGNELPVQPIQISGDVSARGGACQDCDGGTGGAFEVYPASYGTYAPDAPAVELLGYARAVLDGGDGLDQGGSVSRVLELYTWADPNSMFPPGPIENEVDVSARGGDATGADGSGGGGNDTALYWQVDAWSLGGGIVNSGAIDTSGGAGTGSSAGGDSGGLEWYTPGDLVNTGRIVNRGGDAEDGNGGAGNWYQTWLVAQGDIVNGGAIDTTGGTGSSGGAASDGWDYHTGLYCGGQVRNSGALVSRGGDANDAADGTSGGGGHIELYSQSIPTANAATLDVAFGAGGATSGLVGEIVIDSVDVTPANGVL
jgi:hypothetical protein